MSELTIFLLIVASALIQASFQLSVSVMTVMSGHSLGRKTSTRRLRGMMLGYWLGAAVMVALGISTIGFIITNAFGEIPLILWSILSGSMIGVGIAVWLFYYRHNSPGTMLWIPRSFADYLTKRARATSMAPEAFALGSTSVVSEIAFIATPSLAAAMLILQIAPGLQLLGLGLYTLIATLPLLIIIVAVGSGHSLALVQRWRERNKSFLQFAAASALIVLSGYIYVQTVVTTVALGGN